MEINNIQNYNFAYKAPALKNRFAFGNEQNNDTFVSNTNPQSLKYYDDMIARIKAKLQAARDKYAYYENILALKKIQIINLNRLQNAAPIEFKRAKSLEEAKQFASDFFHIKYFNVNDLPTANFINESLTGVLNLSKGNIFMPSAISIVPITQDKTKGEYKIYENEIRLDDSSFNSDSIIDNPEELQKLSFWEREKYDMSTNELKRILFHELGHCNYYCNKAQKEIKIVLDTYSPRLRELNYSINHYNEQIEQLTQEKEKISNPKNHFIKKFANIFSSESAKPEQITQNETESDFFDDLTPKDKENLPWGTKEEAIALLISAYAKTDREEFVAETFAKMCMQDSFYIPKQVYDMYIESGGIIFDCMVV